jgi:allantoinase
MSTWVLQSRRVVFLDGVRPARIRIRGERIEAVWPHVDDVNAAAENDKLADENVVDVGDAVVMAGIVDTHAHLNEPGRTEWEGFVTATRACAAGGITTVVDMPLNSIPVTTSRDALRTKRDAVAGKARVDFGFWGGVVPGNDRELAGMVDDGVHGFKAFLCHSGIDDFPASDRATLERSLSILGERSVPLLAHAEIEDEALAPALAGLDARAYRTYLESRPASWEVAAIELLIGLSRKTRGKVHVVHLSAADALPLIADAKAEGLAFSVETCPHYLTLAAETIPDGATEYKCAPPIRAGENQTRLWEGLTRGIIDQVVSDHSPCTPALKRLEAGDFMGAWGGIASLQLGLPLLYTKADSRGLGDLPTLSRWLSAAPAKLAGLAHKKGQIAAGLDADFVVWDPATEWTIDATKLFHRHPVTPYAGKTVRGKILATYLRGRRIFDGHEPEGDATGEPLVPRHVPASTGA